MDKPIVAAVQHKLVVTKSLQELQSYYHRFMRIAKSKGAKLAVFPEFSGLAVGIPMFPGWRNSLLKEAAAPQKGLFPKLRGLLAGGVANVMRADMQKSLRQTLAQMPESLFDIYVSFFSELAQQYDMTLVAGSIYAYDVQNKALRNLACIFGPDGNMLGQHTQVVREPDALDEVQPGEGWQAIDTPVGRIGLLFGHETLYPEPARVLAYQGAEMLIAIAATKRPAEYYKIRQAALARCQENQLYGLASFLVGADPFADADAPLFMGKSAIFAPLDFTPRFSGVMIEMGSAQAEGAITAEWDYPALHELWSASETPLRRQMPLAQVRLLAQVYGHSLTLDDAQQLQLAASEENAMPEPPLLAPQEDELPEGDEQPQEVEEEEMDVEEVEEKQEGDGAPEPASADIASSGPQEDSDDLFSVVTPILPTEPVIYDEPEPEPIELDDDADIVDVGKD